MGLEIYKPGQARWTRGIAYFLGVALVVFGGVRLYATINRPTAAWTEVPLIGAISPYNTIAFVVSLLGVLGVHLLLNRPGTVDLLIDTEQELKKVSWPSKPEVKNATLVVVLVTVVLAALLAGFDWALQHLFPLVWGR